MNTNLVSFFALSAAVFAFLAWRFIQVGHKPFRSFGVGLGLFAAAFVMWGYIVATRPADVQTFITIAVVPFAAAFFAMLSAATTAFKFFTRVALYIFVALYLVTLFVLRTWVFPSEPNFSEGGLFYFGAHPIVMFMYILAFVGTFMTAVQVVTLRMKSFNQAARTRVFFNLVTVCGVVMLTSLDDTMQTINGYVMLGALIVLAIVHGRNKIEASK